MYSTNNKESDSNSKFSNIVDIPLEPGGSDSLGINKYVKALEEFIKRAETPITMSIQGEWGSGKTSLMNQLKQGLCESNKGSTKPFRSVWLNIWKMSLMHSPEETLVQVIREITKQISDIIQAEYHIDFNDSSSAEIKDKIGVLGRKFLKYGVTIAANLAGKMTGIGNVASINETDQNEQEISVKEDISIPQLQKGMEDCINFCYEKDIERNTESRGFLFFVDDLDRLDPAVAVNVLELLKNVFECKHCVFILAIDYEVVVRGLEPKFGKLEAGNERQFRSFFDKIIQLPFIMPVQQYDVKKYVDSGLTKIRYFDEDELKTLTEVKDSDFDVDETESPAALDDADKGESPEGEDNGENYDVAKCAVELIRRSTGQNPRSMIRLINSLSLNQILCNGEDYEQTDIPTSILKDCKQRLANLGLTCLQISYGTIYTLLQNEPCFVNWDEKFANRSRLPKFTEKEGQEEADDIEERPWRTVIQRAVQNNVYMRQRIRNIEALLAVIAKLATGYRVFDIEADETKRKDLRVKLKELLSFSAVTDASSQVSSVEQISNRNINTTVEELIGKVKAENLFEDEKLVDYLKNLLNEAVEICGNNIKIESRDGSNSVSLKLNDEFRTDIRARLLCTGVVRKGVIQFPSIDSSVNINRWTKDLTDQKLSYMRDDFLRELSYNFKLKTQSESTNASDAVIDYEEPINKAKEVLVREGLIENNNEIKEIKEILQEKYGDKFSNELVPCVWLDQHMNASAFVVQGFCLNVGVRKFLPEYIDNILPYLATQNKEKLGNYTSIRNSVDLKSKSVYQEHISYVKQDNSTYVKSEFSEDNFISFVKERVIERINTTVEIYKKALVTI